MFMRTLISAILLTTSALVVETGDPKPFAGSWAIDFENPKNRLNFADATCQNPATVTITAEDRIGISLRGSDVDEYEVKSFEGKIPWWSVKPNGPTFVADWIDEDNFLLAGRDASGRNSDWKRAKRWVRCPD